MVTHRALYLSSTNIVTGVAIGLEKVAKEDDVPSSDVCHEAPARLKRHRIRELLYPITRAGVRPLSTLAPI
jgi:hypothetical protein